MDVKTIIQVVITVLMVVFGFMCSYLKTKSNVINKAKDFINKAEEEYKDATKSGGLKFEWCVEGLYSLVPSFLKPFISKEMISNIVQDAFDIMAKYATQQLDKVTNKVIEKTADAEKNDVKAE